MSSMTRKFAALTLLAMVVFSAPAQCQDGSEWDRARAELVAGQPTGMSQAIARWQQLSQGSGFAFDDYAGFLLAYPGFPDEAKMRVAAETALASASPSPSRTVAFFDRFAPVTNPARAQYALALAAMGRPEAAETARAAWRGGPMSDMAEAAIQSQFGATFTAADQDARADALLWAGSGDQASRAMANVTPTARPVLMARLALVQGSDPESQGLSVPGEALRDLGYVYNRVRQLRRVGRLYEVTNLLATRPPARNPALDQRKWVSELLNTAKGADANSAVRIAASIDDAFPAGQDVSRLSFQIRDDYTTLMWLGGMKALNSLGDGARAAPLFYRYGAAARTPQTRSKGFYWAGRALTRAGDSTNAARYFDMAAKYPDQFYGMLASERLGRPLPAFDAQPSAVPTAIERAAFMARPITQAVREVARASDWQTGVRFFREICDQAQSEADHVMVADLARQLGRRDLGVILGQAAHADGFGNFQKISFPLIPTPQGSSWTMVHAITRQESQFAQNAVSHAGARGLMQLMPGTARDQARMLGYEFDFQRLTSDPAYNLMLGDFYFGRLMDTYQGSYPLAVAAYNAGPGNVNKWLRDNGDPRNGGIEWVDWIERIPLTETRGYVQHVLENAAVYDTMNPNRALYRGPNLLSHFLGKQTPG
ncbi:MAG: lytic transglycosylase domain-containing protein [Sphingomonadales bacterium]|nr:lytic transglycosylase domain-containing protein [Sphingomonadales bacterium]